MSSRPTEQRSILLAIGPSAPNTGLTRVVESITFGLAEWLDVEYLGIGYRGPVVHPRPGVTVRPTNLEGGDVFASYQGKAFIEDRAPEFVLLVNDVWMLASARAVLEPVRDRTTIFGYCPLDGRIVDPEVLRPLEILDCLVVYTEFARREIEGGFERLRRLSSDFRVPAVERIPHGVDLGAFRPLPTGDVDDRLSGVASRAARERLFPDDAEMADAFLVLNANRPMPRKRIDLTIEAFSIFARDKPPGVKLYLHHAVMNAEERGQVAGWAERWNVADRLILTPPRAANDLIPDDRLNLLYNACDVGLNTAMGEGWGLVAFEHAATGAPQVVPRHSACAELWDGSAELVEPTASVRPDCTPLEMATVSPEATAAALERLYCDPDHRRRMALAAYRNATRPEYRWSHIAETWRDLFQRCPQE